MLITIVTWLLLFATLFLYPDEILIKILLMVYLVAFLLYQFYITAFLSFNEHSSFMTCFRIKKKIPLKNIIRISGKKLNDKKKSFIITYIENNKELEIHAALKPQSKHWRQFRFFIQRENPAFEWKC